MNKRRLLILSFILLLACLLFADPPDWEPMTGNQYNMQLYAEVTLYEQPFENDPGNIVAAFGPGGQSDCRAIGFWDEIGPYAMWYFTIRSNASAGDMEPINFLVYDAQTDQVYECLGEFQIYFADNSVIGSIYDPYQLTAPANLPPVSMPDSYTVLEDSTLIVDAENGVLANDYDPEGLALTAELVTGPQYGVFTFNSDGSFYYQPAVNFYGSEYFVYRAYDGVLYGDEVQVDLTVQPVNDPPYFEFPPGGFEFMEDGELITDFSQYIFDIEDDEITQLTATGNQNVLVSIDGLEVHFSAEPNWFGSELITFEAVDANGASSSQQVLITVIPVNDPPVINLPDSFVMNEDEELSVDFATEGYVYDVDSENLVLIAADNFNVQVNINGLLVDFIPSPNWFGSEVITFTVSDDDSLTASDIVEVIVEAQNDAPIIQFPPEGFSFNEDQQFINDFSQYISDPENDEITSLTASTTEYININVIGLVVQMTASDNWFGQETVTFTVTDEFGAFSSSDVIVTVNPVNDPPQIDIPFDQFGMNEDETQQIDLSQYISDIDNEVLSLSVFDNDNIAVEVDSFTVTLMPEENWFGSEVLNFVVTDEVTRLTDNDYIEIIVNPVNDPPVINIPQEEVSFNEDESLLLDISDYVYDVDNDPLEIMFSGNYYIMFDEISPTSYQLSATLNWFGSELITFTVSDTAGLQDQDELTINVISVPDAPVIDLPESIMMNEDEQLNVDFENEGYVYDVDSSNLLLYAADNVYIEVEINGLSVDFIPAVDWFGSEFITFTVMDDDSLQASDEVEVIVNPINDPPVIDIEDTYTFREDETLQVDFSQYISDVDPDSLSLSASGNQNVIIDINDFLVTFSALPQWNGSELVTFTVNDNQGRAVASDTTNVIVLPANDEPEFNLPPQISFYEDNTYTVDFQQYIEDDSDSLALVALPLQNIEISIEGLMVTFVPDANWFGVETATFTVSDEEFDITDTVPINVIPVNDPPQINVPLEFVFNPNQTYNYNFQNFVFDLDSDTLQISVEGNQEVMIDINDLMVTFTTGDWLGVETVIFTVDDGMNRATSFDQTDLIVTDDTQMPVIYLPEVIDFNEDNSRIVDFNPYIYNDSQVQVILSANTTENIIVEIDTLTNLVNFSAPSNWFGQEMVTFNIYAPGYDYMNSDSTMVIVNPVNDPPQINLPVEGFSFLEDNSLTVNLNLGSGYISDVDDTNVFITLQADNPESMINLNFTDNIAYFTAELNYNGTEAFNLSVNDGNVIVEEQFNVTVIPVNDAPVIELPEEFSFPENDQLIEDFEQYITDVDQDDYIINLVNETDFVYTQINGHSVTFSSLENWNGYEALVFSVNDQQGRAIDIDTVMVNVTPVNTPPYIASPLPDLEIMENSSDSSINLYEIFADYDTDPALNQTVTDSLVFSYFEPGESNFNIDISDGIVTIEPMQNWFGIKDLYFIATDTQSATVQDITTVTVISVNYPPQVVEDIPDFEKLEDFADFTIDLDLYFDDQDGDALLYTPQFDPNQINAIIDNNILTISSLENWSGQAGIIIIATDPDSLTASDGFVVNVTPVNDPPEIELPEQFTLQEDIQSTFDFENYACDCDDDVLIIFNSNTENIQITYNDSIPTEVYMIGNENWFGAEMVTFYASDQTSGRLLDSDSVLVVVQPVNDPPVIDVPDEGFTFAEDNSLVVDFSDYIYDVDSSDLSIIISDGAHVQAEINNYIVTFTADQDWFGTEQHNFSVGDGQFYDSESAPVIVTPVNDPPTITLPPSFTTEEDTPLIVDFTEFVNDIDNTNDELTLTQQGTNPNVTISIIGLQVTFDPAENYYGSANITFNLADDSGAEAQDNVQFIVSPVNDAPEINLPPSFSFNEDQQLLVDFEPYLSDVDEDELYLSVQNNEFVIVTITGFDVLLTAPLNWNGTENITFIVSDQQQRAIDSDNVDIIVNPVNDPPVINLPAQFRFNEDASSEIDFTSFISDIENNDLALQVSNNDTVIVDINIFDVTLSAPHNFFGSENITFTVYETVSGLSDEDDVLVIVNPVNDAPVINLPAEVNVFEEGTLELDMTNFITDVDDVYDDLVITSAGTPHIDVLIEGTMVTLFADSTWNGTEVIEFTVNDPDEFYDTDNMNVNILPVNDPPVIELPEQFGPFPEDNSLTVYMNFYVSDVDGDSLSLTVSDSENLTVNIDGLAVNIMPDANWFGEEMLTFTVSDNVNRLTASDSVLVIVESVNDAPVINLPVSLIAIENVQETFDLSEFIYDVDGDSLILEAEAYEQIDSILVDGLTITFVDDEWLLNENVRFTVYDPYTSSFDIVNVTLIPEDEPQDPGGIVITLPSFDGLEPGEDFTMPININIILEEWGITGFNFNLIFNPDVLEFLGWNLEGTICDTTRVQTRNDTIFIQSPTFLEPIEGAGALINIDFTYISNEYEQDVVELEEFEFTAPDTTYDPLAIFAGVVNNDFPTLNDSLQISNQMLEEDFTPVAYDLNNYFIDNTPNSMLEFSVSSYSNDFAVTIEGSQMNILPFMNKNTNSQPEEVIIVCYDRFLYSVRDTFYVTVDPINDPPVLNIPNFQIYTDADSTIDFSYYISDVDNTVSSDVYITSLENTTAIDPDYQIESQLIDDLIGYFIAPHNWTGNNYFRIAVSDGDSTSVGTFTFEVIYGRSDDVHCYPNPMNTDDGTNFVIQSVNDLSEIKISIYDFAGRKVCSQTFNNTRGSNEINWMGYTNGWNGSTSGTKLARGVYFARVVGKDDFGEIALEKVIKLVIKE